MLNVLSFLVLNVAEAVPLQVTQQGRIIDANGTSLSGAQTIVFRIYDDPLAGTKLWESVQAVNFTNGYYVATLGADVNNPLNSDTLSLHPLYLELQLSNNAPMFPRHTMSSTPYAQIAGVAESVEGGAVNASEVSIGLTPVIDSGGHWVGPSMTVEWSSINNIPSDLADGDQDTQLSEIEVETMVTNDAIDLSAGSTVAGSPILTAADATMPDWTDVTNRPPGLDDGDDNTQLSELEVEGMVTNGPLNLNQGTTIGGITPIGDPGCSQGQLLIFDAGLGNWICGEDSNTTLTSAEMQAMIEAMSLNLQNMPQVNGSDVLTTTSTVLTHQIDGSTGSEGQILSLTGGIAAWNDSSGGGCEVVETIVGSPVRMRLNCGSGTFIVEGSTLTASGLADRSALADATNCAIPLSGGVTCWGDDDARQVRDAPTTGIFTFVSQGQNHICAIKDDQSVMCWGNDGDNQVSSAPSGSYTELTSGYYHSCGLRTDGGIDCWGNDSYGQVSNIPSGTFTQIGSGGYHICAIGTDESLICWGRNHDGELSYPSGSFSQTYGGHEYSCALKTNGGIECWGNSNTGNHNHPSSGAFAELYSGYNFSCGLEADGDVTCWGNNSAVLNNMPSTMSFAELTLGYHSVCGLMNDGSIYCWGDSSNITGTPSTGAFTELQSSRYSTCGILEAGNVICWGNTSNGQLNPP